MKSTVILLIARVLKLFGWISAIVGAIFCFIALVALSHTPMSMWPAGFLAILVIAAQTILALTMFYWLAYILLLLHRIALHSRRQTRLLFHMAGPLTHPPASRKPLSSSLPVDLAPEPGPDSTAIQTPPPDPTLPRGFMITGLDKNGLKFTLTYQWITREDAIARATADGLVEILDITPLRK